MEASMYVMPRERQDMAKLYGHGAVKGPLWWWWWRRECMGVVVVAEVEPWLLPRVASLRKRGIIFPPKNGLPNF
jgi:hypothetical protein